ncbi:MAG: hypothetical protein U9Q81_19850 [Pseudomonadota bacterium]|nr:hypothetical protein [Pseudomonadota bacterium]
MVGKRRPPAGTDEPVAGGRAGRRRARIGSQTTYNYTIQPRITDPEIDNWRDSHYVAFDPGAPRRGKLFLFFCGSYGIPLRQRLIIHLAAQVGYHAINLSYPNSWTVGGLCTDSDDPDCHELARMEILDGVQRSGLIDIGRANSIYNRLETLLRYLRTEYGADGWADFTRDGEVDWGSVVVAGHSQGGGQAALLAKLHPVDRVVMFASPVDYLRRRRVHAPWLSRKGATPGDRYYGFVHLHDNGFDRIQEVWQLLGMAAAGPVVNVDEYDPPYGHARRLVTGREDIRRAKYHGSVVQDGVTPTGPDGAVIFEPVWRYLLGD